MGYVKKIFFDFRRLAQILGFRYALTWLIMILLNLKDIIKRGDLLSADIAMGVGPYKVSYNCKIQFTVTGPSAFSGIREMYARDVYLRHGLLEVKDGDIVLDLGANMGNFTALALAHAPSVTVIAVEPNLSFNETFRTSVGLNEGFLSRVRLFRCFLGGKGEKQSRLMMDPEYQGADWLSESEFIDKAGITRIDFLKCDIEGGEFGLLKPGGLILTMAKKIAIEVHRFAGDVEGFLAMLASEGFNIKYIQRDPDGSVTVIGERARPGLLGVKN